MNSKSQDEIIYSRVNIQKIGEHKSIFGIPDTPTDLQIMPLNEYRIMSHSEAFFYVDHNGFLRHQFSGEVLAANKEQIEVIIEHLRQCKNFLTD